MSKNVFLKGYYYLFYRFYKFFEAAPSKWMSEWKAGIALTVIDLFVLFIIDGYYFVYSHTELLPTDRAKLIIAVVAGGIAFFNFFLLERNGKKIIMYFDKQSPQRSFWGKIFFWSFIIYLIFNLCYMFHLTGQVEWEGRMGD